jgi:hypothetical protein
LMQPNTISDSCCNESSQRHARCGKVETHTRADREKRGTQSDRGFCTLGRYVDLAYSRNLPTTYKPTCHHGPFHT